MRKLRITIGNRSWDVTVEDLTEGDSYQTSPMTMHPAQPTAAPPSGQPPQPVAPHVPVDGGAVTSPMSGVIKSVLVNTSDQVKLGQPLIVLEAMKMENQISAHVAGTVKSVHVKEGDSVREGHVLLELE